jgi:hypothetical protein
MTRHCKAWNALALEHNSSSLQEGLHNWQAVGGM